MVKEESEFEVLTIGKSSLGISMVRMRVGSNSVPLVSGFNQMQW